MSESQINWDFIMEEEEQMMNKSLARGIKKKEKSSLDFVCS